MATLDVLDHLLRLDDALGPHLKPGERKLARKEVRRTIDDMAFRFAILDGRVMPEDIDYARALEAVKPPERLAPVLARRRPVYRQRRVRSGVTTLGVLVMLAVAVGGFASFVTSEHADVLVDEWRVGSGSPVTRSESTNFTVEPGTSRIQFTASVVVLSDKTGTRENTVTLSFLDPMGVPRHERVFTSANRVYDKASIEVPSPGQWTLFVDFRDAAGSAEVTVLGVTPS